MVIKLIPNLIKLNETRDLYVHFNLNLWMYSARCGCPLCCCILSEGERRSKVCVSIEKCHQFPGECPALNPGTPVNSTLGKFDKNTYLRNCYVALLVEMNTSQNISKFPFRDAFI